MARKTAASKLSVVLYSHVRTCALQRVDAQAYLTDVLRKLAAGWPAKRLDDLLPENWSAAAQDPTAETSPVH